jgi:hypothetical protein
MNYSRGSFQATFTGPFNQAQEVTVDYLKIEGRVLLAIPAVTANANPSAAKSAKANSSIPVELRPDSQFHSFVPIVSLDTDQNLPGRLRVNAVGDMVIFFDPSGDGSFGVTSKNGWRKFTCQYSVA